LMDFGMAVRSHSASGTPLRYFRAVGKDFYRAPECYVPRVTETSVDVPSDAKGDDIIFVESRLQGSKFLCEVRLPSYARPGEKACKAEFWGYAACPADIWAVGICIFILGYQCPPWNSATLDDEAFAYVYSTETGLEAMLQTWGKSIMSAEMMELVKDLLRPMPSKRPSAQTCLQSSFITGVLGKEAARKDCIKEANLSNAIAQDGCGGCFSSVFHAVAQC